MRAVLDPNVIISALLSPTGAPARALRAWQEGAFELVVSAQLLSELERALAYPKLRRRIDPDDAQRLIEWLGRHATLAPDPDEPPQVGSTDPGDDYLLSLAGREQAALVSGDRHLLVLADELPVFSAASFLALLEHEEGQR